MQSRIPSPRERQVLTMAATGKTNAEIGQAIFLSEKTVKNYMRNIFARYGVHTRIQAILYALRKGHISLLDLDEFDDLDDQRIESESIDACVTRLRQSLEDLEEVIAHTTER